MYEINEIRNKILQGDVLEQLALIPDESVHCVITSPPYWGLRRYFSFDPVVIREDLTDLEKIYLSSELTKDGVSPKYKMTDIYDIIDIPKHLQQYFKPVNEIGLEQTPNDYINTIVSISREVKRVLRKDGTYWLNLGDRFSPQSSHKGGTHYDGLMKKTNGENRTIFEERSRATDSIPSYGKEQCLMGIPWAVAFALINDGWILRRDIIWAKSVSFCHTYVGSCMPEPVKNRAVSSHEYVFMLTKKSSKYYYDYYGVREKSIIPNGQSHGNQAFGVTGGKAEIAYGSKVSGKNWYSCGNRNLRSVWTINPYPTKDCHFATFSPFLILPMVLASTSEYGCCAKCGAPYERIVEKGDPDEKWKKQCGADSQGEYKGESEKWNKQDALGKSTYTGFNKRWSEMQQNASNVKRNVLNGMLETKTIGWKKTCTCDTDEIVKPIVLDPFFGSGTTGIVSGLTSRDFIGIEINKDYVQLAYERIPREIKKIIEREERERKKREREAAEKELSEKILLLMKKDKVAKNFILNKLVDFEQSTPLTQQQKLF